MTDTSSTRPMTAALQAKIDRARRHFFAGKTVERVPVSRPESIVCLCTQHWQRRHLDPVAMEGGWDVLTTPEVMRIRDALVVVCSVKDEQLAAKSGAAGVVLMEHGAGLSYLADDGSPLPTAWGGGRGLPHRRALMLTPGKELHDRHKAAHPDIPVKVIGCPALDEWAGVTVKPNEKPVVVVSTHWDCTITQVPEMRSSWPWLREHLHRALDDSRWDLRLHWHPHEETYQPETFAEKMELAKLLGIAPIVHFEEVLEDADLFISDNSSTLYEFAATGRPVVCLNPPWYRHHVRHGLRFWSHVPGLGVLDPALLYEAIQLALHDAEHLKERRQTAVKAAFGKVDGKASARAVRAIKKRFQELRA